MKKIIELFLLLALCSCTSNTPKQDPKLETIKNHVLQQYAGKQTEYTAVETEYIDTSTVNMSLKCIAASVGIKAFYGDSQAILDTINSRLEIPTLPAYTRDVLLHRKQRVTSLMQQQPEAIDYIVIRHRHTLKTYDNVPEIKLTNYYFFDGNDKLIASVNEEEMNEFARTMILTPFTKYEVAMTVYKVGRAKN